MKEPELSTLSLEELTAKEKTLKLSTALLGGMLIVMAMSGAFLTIEQGFNAFTVLPVAFLPILIISAINLKKIKAEVLARA